MPSENRISQEKFIAVLMRSKSMAEAARELGCSRQAVSLRVQRYRDAGVTGLPEFTVALDADEVQKLVNKHKRRR